jgi:hypothetical protein
MIFHFCFVYATLASKQANDRRLSVSSTIPIFSSGILSTIESNFYFPHVSLSLSLSPPLSPSLSLCSSLFLRLFPRACVSQAYYPLFIEESVGCYVQQVSLRTNVTR